MLQLIIKHKMVSTIHCGGCYHCHYFINISTWCTYLGICNSKKIIPYLYPYIYMQDIVVPKIWVGRLWNLYIYIYIYIWKIKLWMFSNFSNVLMFSIMPTCLNIFGSINHWTQWSIPKTKWIYTKASQISLVVAFYHVCECLGLGGRAPCFIFRKSKEKEMFVHNLYYRWIKQFDFSHSDMGFVHDPIEFGLWNSLNHYF